MKTVLMTILMLACVTLAEPAESPERAFAFAVQLQLEGYDAEALLEFKRFLFYHPGHSKVPEAKLQLAKLTLRYLGDLDQATSALTELQTSHRYSAAAQTAEQLLAYIQEHSDYAGRPLRLYLRGQAAERRREANQAVEHFLELQQTWPQARLADLALVDAARLQTTELDQPNAALDTLRRLADTYPFSAHRPAAAFIRAMAIEAQYGPGTEAISAYETVGKDYPDSEYAGKSAVRITTIRRQAQLLQRQYDPDFVLNYEVLKRGHAGANNFTVVIQFSAEATERGIQATLEDALLKHYKLRPDKGDRVTVEAYFNYPLTKAGTAEWTPGSDPVFTISRRKATDLLKDTILDIFRKK